MKNSQAGAKSWISRKDAISLAQNIEDVEKEGRRYAAITLRGKAHF